jgi:drug/metabolite transporter (DMT)-like permease
MHDDECNPEPRPPEAPMRIATIAGIALIIAGAFVFLRGGSFTTHRDMMDFGGMRVSVEEQHPIRPWLAGFAVLGGAVLVGMAVRTSRRHA